MREQVEFAVEKDSATNSDSECLIQPLYDRLTGRNPWPDLFQPSLCQAMYHGLCEAIV